MTADAHDQTFGMPLHESTRKHRSSIMTVVSENLAPSTTASSWSGKLKALYSPLWLCFLLAILARVWLIVHTHGVMAAGGKIGGLHDPLVFCGGRPLSSCTPIASDVRAAHSTQSSF